MSANKLKLNQQKTEVFVDHRVVGRAFPLTRLQSAMQVFEFEVKLLGVHLDSLI